ncbi:ribonuclease T2-like isoform X2 [Limulus polyphemus]|uniref:Ribonuclease T2-like isoform X2 n=1 Tax=Limulus polyphemus TaxID=6850 RepID=A0ABM1SJ15_LIMPO|nr:ribonuclease T2-like isoform X2 [Limulus polyphemus]
MFFQISKWSKKWSPTVCIDVSKMIVCQMPPGVDCWTIHGLWPGSLKQPSPRFCHTNSSFDLEKIQHLVPDLEKEWPSFFVERKESNFWKYEWKKHGTCAVVLSSLNSQELYFTKTLELKKQYDLLKILKENDIFPSTEKYYMLDNIKNALNSHFKVHVLVKCKNAKDFDHPLLSSVRICMDMNFTLIDCPASLKECKADSVLYLPVKPDEKKFSQPLTYVQVMLHKYGEY